MAAQLSVTTLLLVGEVVEFFLGRELPPETPGTRSSGVLISWLRQNFGQCPDHADSYLLLQGMDHASFWLCYVPRRDGRHHVMDVPPLSH